MGDLEGSSTSPVSVKHGTLPDAEQNEGEVLMGEYSGNKYSDWKKTLSGALDDQRLFCALVTLFYFYVGYTINSVYQDINARDEDTVVHNCSSKSNHRSFYIAWFSIWYCF